MTAHIDFPSCWDGVKPSHTAAQNGDTRDNAHYAYAVAKKCPAGFPIGVAELRETIAELQSILDDPEKLRGVIKSEMTAIKEEFATPRICAITLDTGEMSIEDLVDDKELVIVMTEAQYVKAVPAASAA